MIASFAGKHHSAAWCALALAGVAMLGVPASRAQSAPAEPQSRTMLEMTSPEFAAAAAKTDVMLLPVGAIEEHGPHLPLASDAIGAVGQLTASGIHRVFLGRAAAEALSKPAAAGTDAAPQKRARGDVPDSSDEADVRKAVEAFYAAFNAHGFDRAADFTTDDWAHINPYGGWTRGRDAVLAELRQVHQSFLKDATDTPESIDVRFAQPDAAVVTARSRVNRYVLPDGSVHENERQIRTFVVVKRAGRWLIMQDQNTIVRQ